MINWKAIAVFGAAGFVLSLLVGILSGNPFGVILLRMLLSTVVSAGLGFGLLYLIDRFLPEITARGGAEAGEPRHIDIVVPGENPHAAGPEASEVPEVSAADEAGLDVAEAEEVSGIDELGAEEAGMGPSELTAEGAEVAEAEAEPAMETEVAGAPQSLGSGASYGLDSLSGRGGTVTAGGQQQEPEVVARALRTMMKRDEER